MYRYNEWNCNRIVLNYRTINNGNSNEILQCQTLIRDMHDGYLKMDVNELVTLCEGINIGKTIPNQLLFQYCNFQILQLVLEQIGYGESLSLSAKFENLKYEELDAILSFEIPQNIFKYGEILDNIPYKYDIILDDEFYQVPRYPKKYQLRYLAHFIQIPSKRYKFYNELLDLLILTISEVPQSNPRIKSEKISYLILPSLFHSSIYEAIYQKLNKNILMPLYNYELEEIEFLIIKEKKITIPTGIDLIPNLQNIYFVSCGVDESKIPEIKGKVHILINEECRETVFFETHINGLNWFDFSSIQKKFLINILEYTEALRKDKETFFDFMESTRKNGNYYENVLRDVEDIEIKWCMYNQVLNAFEMLTDEKKAALKQVKEIMLEIIALQVIEEIGYSEPHPNAIIKSNERNELFVIKYGSKERMIWLMTLLADRYYYDKHQLSILLTTDKMVDLEKLILEVLQSKNRVSSNNYDMILDNFIELIQIKMYRAIKMKSVKIKKRTLNTIINRNSLHPAIVREIYKINNKAEHEPLTASDCQNIICLFFRNEKMYNPKGLELLPNLKYINFVGCGVNEKNISLELIETVDILLNGENW